MLTVFATSRDHALEGALLVPDGVASVQLGPFIVVATGHTPRGLTAKMLEQVTSALRATGIVHDNIAAFKLATPTITVQAPASSRAAGRRSRELGMPATVHAIWRNATGVIVNRTTAKVDVVVRVASHVQTHG